MKFNIDEIVDLANLVVQKDANLGKLRKKLVPAKYETD